MAGEYFYRQCRVDECAKYIAYKKNGKIIVKVTKKTDDNASTDISDLVDSLSINGVHVDYSKDNDIPFANFLSPNSFNGEYNGAKIKGRAFNCFGVHRLYSKIEADINNGKAVTFIGDIATPFHIDPAAIKEKKGISLEDIKELVPVYNVIEALYGRKGISKVILTAGYTIGAIDMLWHLIAK